MKDESEGAWNEEARKGKLGYQSYPERKDNYKPSWVDVLLTKSGKENIEKMKCENRVLNVIKQSPVVRLFLNALEQSGCPIDISRHITCEVCDKSLLGGYDPQLNQIVVCQNVCTSEGRVQGALAHELVHMFDHCNNEIDFTNIDHLACAEIKAANLTSCSFMTALSLKTRDYFTVAGSHSECVKTKASWSVQHMRGVSPTVAREAIEKVFPKCYNDLEPLGLRPRRNSSDFMKAYRQRSLYGYS